MKVKKVILLLLMLFLSSIALGRDCRKTGSVCVDAAASKIINSSTVTLAEVGGCWKYTDTYDCLAAGTEDYCAPLVSAGCGVTSSVCTTTAFNGECEIYTKTYRCGISIGNPSGTVVLDNTYTLIQDTTDRTPCDSITSNSACTLAENVCIEPAATRNINGLDIYKDCWKYEERYACSAGTYANYCAPLQTADCVETGAVCKNTAWNSECLEYERTFNCNNKLDPIPANVTYLNSSYTLTEDNLVSACTTMEGNPNCTYAGTTCIEGSETRNINGLDVYKDCWKTQKEFVCASTTLVSDCDELKNRPECLETTTPICVDTLPGGQCGLLEHTYECSIIGSEKSNTVTDCSTQKFCIDGTCFDTAYSPDNDFGRVISSMEALRQAVENNLFTGTHDECASKRAFGLANCCKNKTGGKSNADVAQQLGVQGLKIGYEAIKVYGSPYVYDAMFNSGIDFFQNYAAAAIMGPDPFGGGFSIWGAEFAIGLDGITFVGFDPWSLAISIAFKVLTSMMTCEEEDMATSMKKGMRLCHKVGSYCDKKVLGACMTRKESYCCFTSKLGRIIQIQGRAQLGRSWGDAKDPDCSGLTLVQLAQLDFSQFDFSEFIRDIPIPTKSSAYATDRLQEKARSYYGH